MGERGMRADWIECDKFLPDKDGVYLVTTAKGAVIIDRFIDGAWAKCLPSVKGKGRYSPHKAWTFLPHAARFDEKGNLIRRAE